MSRQVAPDHLDPKANAGLTARLSIRRRTPMVYLPPMSEAEANTVLDGLAALPPSRQGNAAATKMRAALKRLDR